MFDYISPIEDQLTENFHTFCKEYVDRVEKIKKIHANKPINVVLAHTSSIIGSSPRWFNIGRKDNEWKKFRINSTQYRNLGFWVMAPTEEYWQEILHGEIIEFWSQLKEWRTEFLLNNYPTIVAY